MRQRPLLLGLQLGLFQLGLGIFGVLAFGLFNRLLIEEFQLPAVLVAAAIGFQQLRGLPECVSVIALIGFLSAVCGGYPSLPAAHFFWRCCSGLPASWFCSSEASWRAQGQRICPG